MQFGIQIATFQLTELKVLLREGRWRTWDPQNHIRMARQGWACLAMEKER